MENQKLENLLNLALNVTQEELEKSENLSVGYESEQRKWEKVRRVLQTNCQHWV